MLHCFTQKIVLLLLLITFVSLLPPVSNAMKVPSSKTRSIAEHVWRVQAQLHQERIYTLLAPGILPPSHDQNTLDWRALDPQHPVTNFLRDYYGLKGLQGVRRLARWSPSLSLLPCHDGGILLQGGQDDDFAHVLSLRGAVPVEDDDNNNDSGILYSPALFFHKQTSLTATTTTTMEESIRAAAPYLWYRAVLQQTLQAAPHYYCHGLHEWAMQYTPSTTTAAPPKSAQYQAHLPLRVSSKVICETVERQGVHCTHVDALKYFAPAAVPLNQCEHAVGRPLVRHEQLLYEQPACVHAHMDLLKMTLKLQPFVDAALLAKVLELSLHARRLDVAASPYDASAYGIAAIPIETLQGRAQYRQEQKHLVRQAQPLRRALLHAYEQFLRAAFAPHVLQAAWEDVVPMRDRERLPSVSSTATVMESLNVDESFS
jgi:hypothetical protein